MFYRVAVRTRVVAPCRRAHARCSAVSQPLCLCPWSRYKILYCDSICAARTLRAVLHARPAVSHAVLQHAAAMSRRCIAALPRRILHNGRPSAMIQRFVSQLTPGQTMCAHALPHAPPAGRPYSRPYRGLIRPCLGLSRPYRGRVPCACCALCYPVS